MVETASVEDKTPDKENVSVGASIPVGLLEKIEQVRKARFDKNRADTVRFLILKALADLDFLTEAEKIALGLHPVAPKKEAT